jgi:hypothetical protein
LSIPVWWFYIAKLVLSAGVDDRKMGQDTNRSKAKDGENPGRGFNKTLSFANKLGDTPILKTPVR